MVTGGAVDPDGAPSAVVVAVGRCFLEVRVVNLPSSSGGVDAAAVGIFKDAALDPDGLVSSEGVL